MQRITNQKHSRWTGLAITVAIALCVIFVAVCQVSAGNKGNKGKGKGEDIILYQGNIVMRGDKKGGTIVLANQHPHHEEVEFAPNYFHGYGDHGHGGHGGHGGFGGYGGMRRR